MVHKKLLKLYEIIRINGGIFGSLKKLYYCDALKEGRLVGQDQFGNRYYENNRYFMGANRWVEYNKYYYLDYDASQIPPEWFGWMHHKTDMLPCEDPRRQYYSWSLEHTENMTGSKYQYYPYSTSRPKITTWSPKEENKNECKS